MKCVCDMVLFMSEVRGHSGPLCCQMLDQHLVYFRCLIDEDETSHTHHERVRLGGERPVLSAADADAELNGPTGGVREERLGHVAHDPGDKKSHNTPLTCSMGSGFCKGSIKVL